jgi:hypothetical protein
LGLGFKYHIATIVAIFFALTVGLVVGSLYVSPQVADSQKRLILQLRERMDQDVSTQRALVREYQEFFGQSTPRILRDELAGSTVAIFLVGDYPNALNSIRETLRLANAKVSCVVRMGKQLNKSDTVLQATLGRLHQDSNNMRLAKNRETILEQIVALLADTTGQKTELSGILEREDFATFERNREVTSAPRSILVVTGSQVEETDRVTQVDAPLITALQTASLRVVACEPESVTVSDLSAYTTQGLSLPTIPKVDSDIGRCLLVFSLKELQAGFGSSTLSSPSNP